MWCRKISHVPLHREGVLLLWIFVGEWVEGIVIVPFYQALFNRPFPSSPRPLFQNEGRCLAFDMEIIFHSHANKTHFHKKGCAPSLILKVRGFGTRKWPIALCKIFFF